MKKLRFPFLYCSLILLSLIQFFFACSNGSTDNSVKKTDFYGTWKHGSYYTITIDSTKYNFDNSLETSLSFTITNPDWTLQNNTNTVTKDEYPVGYKIEGAGKIKYVFINASKNKIHDNTIIYTKSN